MVAKRRQRRKYTWFPTLGDGAASGEDDADDLYGQHFTLTVPSDGTQALAILPVVPDAPRTNLPGLGAQQNSLEDIIGNEWMLERIVGKFDWAAVLGFTLGAGDILVENFDLAAGFFVARADHSGPDFPIGDSLDLTNDYSPLNANTVREPWLWHRHWSGAWLTNLGGYPALANRLSVDGPYGASASWTLPNANNGNLIDTSSVRRIGQDDRLYFAVAAQQNSWGFDPTAANVDPDLRLSLFVRVLGRVLRAKNDGKF